MVFYNKLDQHYTVSFFVIVAHFLIFGIDNQISLYCHTTLFFGFIFSIVHSLRFLFSHLLKTAMFSTLS